MNKIAKFFISGLLILAFWLLSLSASYALEIVLSNKNTGSLEHVSLYIDGRFGCEAAPGRSCRAKAGDGTHKLTFKNANGRTLCETYKRFGEGQDGRTFHFTYPGAC